MIGLSIFCEKEQTAWVIVASGVPDQIMYSRPAGCTRDRRVDGVCLASLVVHRLAFLRTYLIAAGYFFSPPGMDAFILTVNRTMGAAFPLTPRRQRIIPS